MTPSPPVGCGHQDVRCVNSYEFIRKYECADCRAVMMCACDREFAEKFLPHQLTKGRDSESGVDVRVTIGFQPTVCRECRGLPAESHPKAQLYGRSSKVLRYYWREIYFETTKRFAKWAEDQGQADRRRARREHKARYEEIEHEVIEEIKLLHSRSPKYLYSELSQAEVLSRCGVEIVDLRAEYLNDVDGSRRLVTAAESFATPEEAAAGYFRSAGFEVIDCESRPFHVLFGVYMWLLIQDPGDPLRYFAGFGDRTAYDAGKKGEMVWTFLPKDFGRPGYATRRSEAISEHFRILEDDLVWLFNYWLEPSKDLRQYLWAHSEDDVMRARRIIEILPADTVRRILRYLVESYWARFTGWPDLLVFNSTSYFFAEVKGSGDKLREDQKRWIENNAAVQRLPFKLVKIHRQAKGKPDL